MRSPERRKGLLAASSPFSFSPCFCNKPGILPAWLPHRSLSCTPSPFKYPLTSTRHPSEGFGAILGILSTVLKYLRQRVLFHVVALPPEPNQRSAVLPIFQTGYVVFFLPTELLRILRCCIRVGTSACFHCVDGHCQYREIHAGLRCGRCFESHSCHPTWLVLVEAEWQSQRILSSTD